MAQNMTVLSFLWFCLSLEDERRRMSSNLLRKANKKHFDAGPRPSERLGDQKHLLPLKAKGKTETKDKKSQISVKAVISGELPSGQDEPERSSFKAKAN